MTAGWPAVRVNGRIHNPKSSAWLRRYLILVIGPLVVWVNNGVPDFLYKTNCWIALIAADNRLCWSAIQPVGDFLNAVVATL